MLDTAAISHNHEHYHVSESSHLRIQPLEFHVNPVFLQGKRTALQLVQLFGYWYSHNLASGMFERVPRMPSDLPQQVNRALQALSAIDEGMQAIMLA